jgi:hypothetical protein
MFTTSGTYIWSFVTQILLIGQPSHGADRKTFETMIIPSPILIFFICCYPLSYNYFVEF